MIIYNLVNICSNIVQVRRQSSKFNCHLFLRYWTYEIQPSSLNVGQDLQDFLPVGTRFCIFLLRRDAHLKGNKCDQYFNLSQGQCCQATWCAEILIGASLLQALFEEKENSEFHFLFSDKLFFIVKFQFIFRHLPFFGQRFRYSEQVRCYRSVEVDCRFHMTTLLL